MNEEKVTKVKNKLKKHAPTIAFFAIATTTVGLLAGSVFKQVKVASESVFEPLPLVDRDEQKKLMEDEDFGLYKLTEDEYMFARIIAD